ncbi:MAG: SUMF1/EgtB/PvdO family nonheme iron enzyme [Cyclobacteriaceae bacterium]|nr:SUMF1/EgtB/PvdO family nonheme iron enzyme [Cyclobacteriaceae bacterium]
MPRGIAAVIAIDEKDIDNDFRYFLFQQSIIALNNHNYYNSEKKEPLEALNFPAPTPKYAMNKLPSGMILMPHGKHPVIIEKVDRPIFYLYLDTPMERITDFTLFAIDTKPVTNLEYYQFLQSSGYEPEFKENFLVHWNGARPPKSIENEPVVYVDLNDARAYASWMKKRLPTEEEWVLAMNTKKPDYHNKRVWEWNESERSNGQSRWCTLHGGSFYNATGSIHYADGGPMEPKMGSKYMLMWPGLDRCSTIGFRCVVDVLNK